MSEERTYTDVELKAGLFLFFCLALFVGMLLVYGKVNRFWRGRQEIHVAFASVSKLRPESAVRYNGVEVGNVKSMQILHLDASNLRRLGPLAKADIENLPFTERVRKQLRMVPEYEFDEKARQYLLDKTVIELTLEVLQEGHYRRYRVDDSVRVTTTVMGDASLEIVSGNGRPVDLEESRLLLGQSGDFFTNLSRSVDEVKNVLKSVTEVVGMEERRAFESATGRLDTILQKVDGIAGKAVERVPGSIARYKEMAEGGDAVWARAGKSFELMAPDARRLTVSFGYARDDLGKRITGFLNEIDAAEKELKKMGRDIYSDWQYALKESGPHLDDMKRNVKGLSERLTGLGGKIGNMDFLAGRVFEQGEPDLERAMFSLKVGADNLKSLRYIREKTDVLISNSDRGEHEYYTVQDIYDRLRRITRWPHQVELELIALEHRVPNPGVGQPVSKQNLRDTAAKLNKLQNALDPVLDSVARSLLPPYTGSKEAEGLPVFKRKRAGRQEQLLK